MDIETKEILNIISEFGWYKDRKIDISYIEEDLRLQGFNVPNTLIKSVLEEYWNIRIEYKNSNGLYIDLYLNVDAAMDLTSRSSSKKIEEKAKEPIVPVATINDSYIIWITYSGKFYLTDNHFLFFISDDIISVIDFVLSDKDLSTGTQYL